MKIFNSAGRKGITGPMNPPPLKAVFFDIDDTLYSTTTFAEKARRSAIQAMIDLGMEGEEDELYGELLEVIEEFAPNYPFHFDQLIKRISPDRYQGINPALLIAGAIIAYHQTKFQILQIFQDAENLLKKLSQTSLLLGVITSGLTVKQSEKILRLNLHQYINPKAIFISDQMGINKPNPKLYKKALDTFDLKPEESLYIGDNPIKDIEPAQKLGMWAVWMRRGGKHSSKESKVEADYEISNYSELEEILIRDFSLSLPQ